VTALAVVLPVEGVRVVVVRVGFDAVEVLAPRVVDLLRRQSDGPTVRVVRLALEFLGLGRVAAIRIGVDPARPRWRVPEDGDRDGPDDFHFVGV
jgi:hypothetical protein